MSLYVQGRYHEVLKMNLVIEMIFQISSWSFSVPKFYWIQWDRSLICTSCLAKVQCGGTHYKNWWRGWGILDFYGKQGRLVQKFIKMLPKNSHMILTYNVSYFDTNSMAARWCARPGDKIANAWRVCIRFDRPVNVACLSWRHCN